MRAHMIVFEALTCVNVYLDAGCSHARDKERGQELSAVAHLDAVDVLSGLNLAGGDQDHMRASQGPSSEYHRNLVRPWTRGTWSHEPVPNHEKG
jgi:hypothetical protein